MLKSPFYPGDLVTRTGEQEISAVSGSFPGKSMLRSFKSWVALPTG